MQTDSVEKAAGHRRQSAYGPHCVDGLVGLLFSMPSA